MRARTVLAVVFLLAATPSLADDPTLIYRAPSLAPHGGAWNHRPAAPAARDLHAAEVNARAQLGIDAVNRDNMRRIDDGVILRLGNPEVLPQVRRQRELEEDLAGMRHQERWRQIEVDLDRAVDPLGRPLGPATRRVFEESGIQMWVRERKDEVTVGADGLEAGLDAEGPAPEIGDLVEPGPRLDRRDRP